MKKRMLLLLLLSLWANHGVAAVGDDRPNIVLIISDDHIPTALGCAGNPVVKTPELDRLAAKGVRFSRCFTPNPICSTSRAAILTGQDSWTNGCTMIGVPIKSTSVQWPKLLSDAGYQTFYTGKWHNDGRPSTRGFNCGANIFLGGMGNHNSLPIVQFDQPKKTRKPADKFSSELFADAAVRFLETRSENHPFCIYLSFTAPHDPWMPPGQYATMYDPNDIPVPENFLPRASFQIHESFPTLRDQSQLPYPRTKADVRHALALYYGMISHMDAQIGRVLDKIEQLDLSKDTLVIFVGDQGYSMGSHGFVGKQTMYEEGIRTPLIIRYPRLKRGASVSEAMVSLIDLFPTICEAADVSVPESVESRTLLGLYQGKEIQLRDHLFASFHSPKNHHMSTWAIRTTRYKLIHHLLTDEVELFDLAEDPHELQNLANHPEYKKLRKELMAKLITWRQSTKKSEAKNKESLMN